MKQYFIPMLACAGLLMTGCSNNEPERVEKKRIEISLTRGESETLKSINEYAFDLFKAVDAEKRVEEDKGFNYLISPLGASAALGMLANGAEGETLKEITDMLKIGDGSLEDLNECSRTLLNAMTNPENRIDLKITNSLYSKFYKFQPDYLSKMKEFYNATVKDKAVENDMAILEIADVLEFRGEWDEVFKKEKTEPGIFKNADSSEGEAYFMNSCEEALVSEDEICRMLRKTMDKGSFSFDFILPSGDNTLEEVINHLSAEYLENKRQDFSQFKTDIRMPKFMLEKDETDLISPSQSLGMVRAFDMNEAEIPGILITEDNTPLHPYVDKFKQNSSITLDEEGAYIKVVTIIGGELMDFGPTDQTMFILDRPFVYIVSENSTGAILFMGKVSRFKDFELF